MIIRGQFTANGEPDAVFDTLVGVCGELKVKTSNVDTLSYKIDGKFPTNAKRWGAKFHARIVKNSPDLIVEVKGFSLLPTDQFIKEVHKTFLKYMPASQLRIDFVKKVYEIETNEPSGNDSPVQEHSLAPTNDAGHKMPPADNTCRKCGASNSADSKYCNKCGNLILSGCPNCGYVPEEKSSFCIKCGTKLD